MMNINKNRWWKKSKTKKAEKRNEMKNKEVNNETGVISEAQRNHLLFGKEHKMQDMHFRESLKNGQVQ